ncbi:MAG: hypothetical protein QME52_01855 [Bacteroidota bacterium]|nr:hypothetical protein [Bacteroidota bacterium]
MSKEIVAGISIENDRAAVVIFKVKEKGTKLLHIEEFAKTNTDELWYLEKILHPVNRIFKNITKVSVAFDSASAFLHLFPLDVTLSQSEQNEHIHWELSNFIKDYNAKDYINDLHILKTHAREQIDEILVVSAKRSVIFNIQESLSTKGIELHIADTNYFGAECSLLNAIPETKGKTIGLVHLTSNSYDVGIISNARLIQYNFGIAPSAEVIARRLQEMTNESSITEIYCCGPAGSVEFIETLKSITGIDTLLFNPFQKVKTSRCKTYAKIVGLEHRFAVSAGVALWRR